MRGTSLSLLRQSRYRRWAIADFVSSTGTWLQIVGVHVFVLLHTSSATSVGLTVLLTAAPAVVLGPFAGAIVDKVAPRRVLLITQSLQATLALMSASVIYLDAHVLAVQLLASVAGVVSVFNGPAVARFNLGLIHSKDVPKAIAMGSLCNSIGRIVGTALAGVLVALIGSAGLYVLDALSFGVVVLTLMTLPAVAPSVAPRTAASVRGGVRHVIERPHLVVTLLLSIVLGSIGRNFQVTMAAVTAQMPHAGAVYGLLSACFGIGAFAGAAAGAFISKVRMPLLFICASGAALVQTATAMTSSVAAFASALAVIAIGAVLTDTGLSTVIQAGSAEDMRGRVVGLQGVAGGLAAAVGAPVVGYLNDTLGVRFAMLINGSLTLLACVIAALVLRKVNPWSHGVSWLKGRYSQLRGHRAGRCCAPSTRFAAIRCAISSRPLVAMDQ